MTQDKEYDPIKSALVRSLRETLQQDTQTPSGPHIPCDIYIPYSQVKIDEPDPGFATVTATYVVQCPTEKKHTVHIKCKYDTKGKYVAGSMSYV